jgi:cytochrome c oxidase subunit 2
MNHPTHGRWIPPRRGVLAIVIALPLAGLLSTIADADAVGEAGTGNGQLEALMAQGHEVYNQACVFCHQPNGMGLSGSFPPLVGGAPFEAEPSIIQPLERLGLYRDGTIQLGELETHVNVVANGIPGTRMFAFCPQLSSDQIAAVVTYIRNAWGNDTGDVATGEQVDAICKG